jgi:predicted transposase YbfD/YdcC
VDRRKDQLLDVLAVKGCLVTMDATGCQRDIAARIIDKGGDYLLAVKGNQACLEEDAERTVHFAKPTSEWVYVSVRKLLKKTNLSLGKYKIG